MFHAGILCCAGVPINIQTFRVEFFRSLVDHCRILRSSFIGMARSPASRLAGDFLVSCQPAVTSTKVSYQPAGRRPESLLPASC